MAKGSMESSATLQFIRDTDERRYWPAPVLDRSQWKIRHLLKQRWQASEWDVLAGVRLSSFIEAKGHPKYLELIETSVLMAVVTKAPLASTVIVIVEPGNLSTEDILDSEGINWIRYASLVSPAEFVANVVSRVSDEGRPRGKTKRLISHSEMNVKRAVLRDSIIDWEDPINPLGYISPGGDLTWDQAPTILSEVALHRVIPEFHSILDDHELRMIRQSSVDLLVHGRGDGQNHPLVAVEIDGSIHGLPHKILNDQAKDRVLDAFGLPLIRIAPEDADFWKLVPEKLCSKDRKKKRQFEELLRVILQTVAFGVMSSIGDQLRNSDARLERNRREDKLSRSMFDRQYAALSEDQSDVVDQAMEVATLDQDHFLAAAEVRFANDQELIDVRARQDWPHNLLVFALKPTFHDDARGNRWAETTVACGNGPVQVVSPCIQLRLGRRFADDELMREWIDLKVVEYLADRVREEVRASTPAKRQ